MSIPPIGETFEEQIKKNSVARELDVDDQQGLKCVKFDVTAGALAVGWPEPLAKMVPELKYILRLAH